MWPVRPGQAPPKRLALFSSRGLKIAQQCLPTAMPTGTPVMRAMAGFQERTWRSAPTATMPSEDDTRTSASVRCSLRTASKRDSRCKVDDTRSASASRMRSSRSS